VVVSLNARSLAYDDVQGKHWRAHPSAFKVLVGDSSEQIALSGDLTLAAGVTVK
jgi:hypothetical protein